MKNKIKIALTSMLAFALAIGSVMVGNNIKNGNLAEAEEKTYELVLDKNHANPMLEGFTPEKTVETSVGNPHVKILYKNMTKGDVGGFLKVRADMEASISNPMLEDHMELNRITGIKSITVSGTNLPALSLYTSWERHPSNHVEAVVDEITNNVPVVFNDVRPNYFKLNCYSRQEYEINSIRIVYSCVNEVEKLATFTPGLVFEETQGGYAVTEAKAICANIIIPKTYNGKPVVAVNIHPRSSYFNVLYVPETVTRGMHIFGNFQYAYYGGTTNILDVTANEILYGIKGWFYTDDGCNYLLQDLGQGKTALLNDIPDTFESFTIPQTVKYNNEDVTVIGVAPYGICYKQKLKEIIVPDSIKELHEGAFYNNDNLANVILGNGVTKIPHDLFGHINKIKVVDIPEGVTEIRSTGVEYSKNLELFIVPSTCTIFELDEHPSKSHTTYLIRGNNPDLDIDPYQRPEYIYNNFVDYGTLDNGLTYAILNENKQEFAIFIRYNSLSTEVVVPSKVNHLGKEYKVAGLQHNSGPSNPNLKTITIEKGVEIYDTSFFANCPSVKEVFIPVGTTVYNISGDMVYYFDKGNNEGKDHLASGGTYLDSEVVVDDYIGMKGTTRDGFDYAICDAGSGKYAAITGHSGNDNEIRIPREVTHNDVTYPVTYICIHSFINTKAQYIIIHNGIKQIDRLAFNEDTFLLFEGDILESYSFYSQLRFHKTVHNYAGIKGVTSDGLHYALSNISGDNPYALIIGGDRNTSNVVIPQDLIIDGVSHPVFKVIANAFAGDTAIESLTLPERMSIIYPFTFAECVNLKTVNLPKDLSRLMMHCFQNTGISTVTLPDTVTMIDEGAFIDSALTEIFIPKTVKHMGPNVFGYDVAIKCEIASKPVSWDDSWTYSENILWGQTR